jgi:hypothetical protein
MRGGGRLVYMLVYPTVLRDGPRALFMSGRSTFRAIYYGDCVPFAFPLIDVSDRVAPAAHLECILHATILSAHTTYAVAHTTSCHMRDSTLHAQRLCSAYRTDGVPYRPRPRSAQMCYHALLYCYVLLQQLASVAATSIKLELTHSIMPAALPPTCISSPYDGVDSPSHARSTGALPPTWAHLEPL